MLKEDILLFKEQSVFLLFKYLEKQFLIEKSPCLARKNQADNYE